MNRCAKRHVVAKVESPAGEVFYGTNSIRNNDIVECPRAEGDDYSECVITCHQRDHAEMEALEKAGDKAIGGTLTLYGHHRMCEDCNAMAVNYGIAKIIIEVTP